MLSANAQHRARYLIAGMLIGAAAGLKLTNMVFLVGAAASLLYAARPLMALWLFGLGGAVGALGTGGAWAWTLWHQFGNPVFPFYNTIFRSPEAPIEAIADLRFMPRSLWEAIAYRFYWLVGNYRSSEAPFRDPRFAVSLVLFAASAGASLWHRRRIFTARDKQFLLFFAAAYGMWLLTFSIHRYAVVLELLAAPLIVLLLSRFLRVMQRQPIGLVQPAWTSFATMGIGAAIALWSQPADWSRRPWSDPHEARIPEELSNAAIYLMIEKPQGYIVPQLGTGSRVYQLADIVLPIAPGGSLDYRIRAGLAHPPPGGVWTLHLRSDQSRQCLLDGYGWEVNASRTCSIISGADGVDIKACPLRPSANDKAKPVTADRC
jgi:hypothetical protein